MIDAFWEAPTQVTGSVFLGSLRTLESGNVRSLAQQGFRHVVLLCDLQLVRLPLAPIPDPYNARGYSSRHTYEDGSLCTREPLGRSCTCAAKYTSQAKDLS